MKSTMQRFFKFLAAGLCTIVMPIVLSGCSGHLRVIPLGVQFKGIVFSCEYEGSGDTAKECCEYEDARCTFRVCRLSSSTGLKAWTVEEGDCTKG